jgi:hypothetical protein
MAKLIYKTKEDAPESLREHLKETATKDGFEITVAPAAKLNEFRENNVAISKKYDDAYGVVSAVNAALPKKADGAEYTKDEIATILAGLVTVESQVKDGTLKASKDIENTLTERTKSMQEKHTRDLAEANAAVARNKTVADQLVAENHRLQIKGALGMVITDETIGLRLSALPDLQERAAKVMRIDPKEGVVIVDNNGTVLRGEDGVSPMSPKEWVMSLRESAEHFFKGSTGGGAQQGASFAGMTSEQLSKLSPEQRMHLANEESAKAMAKNRR